MAERLLICFMLALPALAFWRIAKRTGHGRVWDAVFGAQLFVALSIVVATDNSLTGCKTSFSSYSCLLADVLIPFIGWVFAVQLTVLALRRWPKDGPDPGANS